MPEIAVVKDVGSTGMRLALASRKEENVPVESLIEKASSSLEN